MRVHHTGYAVSDIFASREALSLLGYDFGSVIPDSARNVNLAFGTNGPHTIELVSPLKKGVPSPVDHYLTRMQFGPYHSCFESDDLETDIKLLCAHGFRVTVNPEPAVAFGGRRVVFLFSLQLGLIELLESN